MPKVRKDRVGGGGPLTEEERNERQERRERRKAEREDKEKLEAEPE